MTEKDYQELNDYLNGCFIELEKSDPTLLSNMMYFIHLSEKYVHTLRKYKLIDKKQKNNNKLTFEDSYLLAREIIENINPAYIEEYDKLISSGELDFGYNHKYRESHFLYDSGNGITEINIDMKFTYDDALALVHEFIHKTNYDKNYKENRYLLTEFLSIYFEEYGKKYLIGKGIEADSFMDDRIAITFSTASYFNWYSLVLFIYNKIGNIDENSYKILNKYYGFNIKKEGFEEECKVVLEKLKKEEKKFNLDCYGKNEVSEEKKYKQLSRLGSNNYRYITGTILAYYALRHCDINKIVYLNDHINEFPYTELELPEVLKTIDIDLYEISIDELVSSVEEEFKERKNQVRK